jgi:hypothetical protein
VAIDNADDVSLQPQDGLGLPWSISPASSWLWRRDQVEILLDPGSVLHKTLPQQSQPFDTLATQFVQDYGFVAAPGGGSADSDAVISGGGVNLNSQSKGQDTIQRMATSTYRFIVKGEAWRVGFQIPIPGLLKVGGQTAVPCFPQWTSGNVIVGNLPGGIPLFHCAWELHYMVAGPLKGKAPIVPNAAARIRADQKLPDTVQVPLAPTDSNAVGSGVTLQFIGGGK